MAKPKQQLQPIFPDEFDECFRKIGNYMFVWACVESGLNRLVTTAMRLGSTDGVIVCANIQVRDKLYIAETAIDLQSTRDDAWRKAAKSTIKKARKHSEDRNRVAHNFFAPEEGNPESIRFFIRKAKGKLEFPDIVWTPKILEEKLSGMRTIATDLERIAQEIKPQPLGLLGGLSALGSYADHEQSSPTPRRGLLGAAFRASRQSPEGQPRLGATLLLDSQRPAGPDPLAGLSVFWKDWPPPRDPPTTDATTPRTQTPKKRQRRAKKASD
jgi:hypothetical protein